MTRNFATVVRSEDRFDVALKRARTWFLDASSDEDLYARRQRIADRIEEAFGGFGSALEGDFKTPKPLPPLRPEAPSLPADLVPQELRGWCTDVSERMQVPLEMIAIPAVIGASSVIGRRTTIRPKAKDSWTVTPNLWGAVVASPSRLKTPALAESLRPIRTLEERACKEHEQRLLDRGVDLEMLRAQEKAIKDLLKAAYKGKPDRDKTDELRDRLQSVKERLRSLEDELSRRRYILNDVTVRKSHRAAARESEWTPPRTRRTNGMAAVPRSRGPEGR